jgi:hypothetical protein
MGGYETETRFDLWDFKKNVNNQSMMLLDDSIMDIPNSVDSDEDDHQIKEKENMLNQSLFI